MPVRMRRPQRQRHLALPSAALNPSSHLLCRPCPVLAPPCLPHQHTIFGEVAEGMDVLEAINEAPCDDAGRPLQVCCARRRAGHSLGEPAASEHACSSELAHGLLHACTAPPTPPMCRTSASGTPSSWTTPPPTLAAWRNTYPTPRRRRRCGRMWAGPVGHMKPHNSASRASTPALQRTVAGMPSARDSPQLSRHGTMSAAHAAQFADDGRLEDDWVPDEEARDPEEIEKANR